MRMELATETGPPQATNEDFVAVAAPASGLGGALVVLDGVTPPAHPDGCVHDVPWFVARLGGALLELSVSRRDMTLPQCLAEAISRTAEAHRSTCDLSHPRTPQATVVLARWGAATSTGVDGGDHEQAHQGGLFEYLVLCDSVLLLESPDGKVSPVLDPSLDDVRLRARGLPRAERVAEVESARNAEGGFHTAAADPSVAVRAVTGALPREQVSSLVALTDGASRWTEVFARGDWSALLSRVRDAGPGALVEDVRALESADPHGERFPRGKAHDDATAAYLSW